MAVYDLEEQDQLEDLKAWWSQWGNYVTGVAVAVCVVLVAVQGWRWWQHSQAEQASVLYGAVSAAARGNELPKAKDAVAELAAKFAGTAYAARAALVVAKMQFDAGDKAGARTQLSWVVEKSDDDTLRQIARYRLAEIQFDDKQYDDALRTLDAKHDDALVGLYADLRGDVLAAAGRPAEARSAYQTAVGTIDTKSPYRNYVQTKLDAFGGPLDPAAATAAGTAPAATAKSAPAPAPAAAAPAPASAPVPAAVPAASPSVPPAAPPAKK